MTAKRGNAFGRHKATPAYKFETASVLFPSEIDYHYFHVRHREFDEVFEEALKKPFISDKSLFGDELEIVYGNNVNKYLRETRHYLELNKSRILKTKFAKSVTCWIYPVDDYVLNYENDQGKALEKIGREIPVFHLIDVWKYLRDRYGEINLPERNVDNLIPTYTRIPLNEIKNFNDWERGFDEGFPLYKQGDKERKTGNFDAALNLFDKARAIGYNAPALYNSYAMLFRQLKAYDDEILILREGQSRADAGDYGLTSSKPVFAKWEERIENVYELKQKQRK